MIRLATVGTSAITDKLISSLEYAPQVVLSAVYSRNSDTGEAFAAKHGRKKVFTDLGELAASADIDAVYIASPNSFHGEQSRLFLENGKHVLCEKPITVTADGYRELKALADKNSLVYMEAIMSRHASSRDTVFKGLSEIGKIALARIDYSQLSSKYGSFMKGEHQNIFDMSFATGTLMDLGVYCVYAAVDLFGKPEKITAFASFLQGGADGGDCAVFEYPSFNCVITCSKTGQSAAGSEIIGDKGTLKIGSVSQYADVSLVRNGTEIKLCGMPERAEIMSAEANKFAAYVSDMARYKDDYEKVSELTFSVHSCMDEIKKSANIIYK